MTRIIITIALVASTSLFAQPAYQTTPDWVSDDRPVSTGAALVDLDRDGWVDLVVSNGNDIARQSVAVYYNFGDGTLPPTPDWESEDRAYNGHLDIADVNGDGWPDVAVARLGAGSQNGTAARVFLNNMGTLSDHPDWESTEIANAFHVAFGDMNNDGRPDLAVATSWPYADPDAFANYVYLNVDGQLETDASWESDDTRGYVGVVWVDADGDGWLDLVFSGSNNDTWLYPNEGGALATTATWRTTDNPAQFGLMVTHGDVNGDGVRELFVTDNTQLYAGSGRFRQYNGVSGGYFATAPSWSFYGGYGSAIALVDVNADGLLDVATGAWWDSVRLFMNTGAGPAVLPHWSSSVSSVIEKIAFGDVDRDGLRYPTDRFAMRARPGQRLFELSHQPVERIESIVADGVALTSNQYTYDRTHGWVTVGVDASAEVRVAYVYSRKPDMAVTNWETTAGNHLYINTNAAAAFGDLDGDGVVTLEDYPDFANCLGGPGTAIESGCEPADSDLDGDADLADLARFTWALCVNDG